MTATAREALAARARRVALIRRRVVAATLAAFVLAWGVIAFAGSMGAQATTATATASASDDSASTAASSADQLPRRHDGAVLAAMDSEHVFWITSRAAGVVALLASSAAVTLGLLMGGRLVRGRTAALRVTHEALSLATIGALLVHALALLGDGFLSPSLADVDDPARQRIPAGLDDDRDRRRMDADSARPLLLRARAHRARALAPAAPLHRAGVAARRRARAVRGDRRGHRMVPGRRRGGRDPGGGAADRAARGRPGAGGAAMSAEAVERFACFGGTCEVRVGGAGAAAAAAGARERLLDWHDRFTRFTTTSELARLNADPREEVPVSATMAALAAAIVDAAERTGGLVDGTLAREIEAAGYPAAPARPLPLRLSLRLVRRRAPARPSPDACWRRIATGSGAVRRPPGVALDSGGLGKGLFADLLAGELAGRPAFVVDCAGDLRLGGSRARPVRVASPFGGEILHTFALRDGGSRPAASAAAAGSTPAGAPRTTCSTPRPAGRRSPAWCRRPRSRRPRWRPRRSRRPPC